MGQVIKPRSHRVVTGLMNFGRDIITNRKFNATPHRLVTTLIPVVGIYSLLSINILADI